MDEQAPGIEAVAAALRQDGQDLALYAGFLLNTLTEALPAELVQLERQRTAADRLRGRPGQVVGVTIAIGDRRYRLVRRGVGARPQATVAQLGGAIVLKTREVALDTWAQELAAALVAVGTNDARAAEALQRLTIPRGADL